jgi:hypothetical protein
MEGVAKRLGGGGKLLRMNREKQGIILIIGVFGCGFAGSSGDFDVPSSQPE